MDFRFRGYKVMANYSGSPQLNERQLALARDRKEWTTALGNRLNVLFGISILNVIILVITFIISLSVQNADRLSEVKDAVNVLKVIAVIALVLAIIYGITICSMGKYNDDLSAAGVLYIFNQVCSVVSNLMGRGSGASSLFNFISLALSIAFILKFCSGMITCFSTIGSGMSLNWESFKTVYLISVIGMLASVLMAIMPGLFGLAVVAVLGFSIMTIIVAIWQIVILRQSATEMLEYTYDPETETRSAAGAFRNMNISAATSRRPVPAPKKPSMTREEARKRAEEMRKRREAKANGIELPESSDEKSDVPSEDAESEEYKIKMLKEYKELLDSGALTQEEFDQKKKEILG